MPDAQRTGLGSPARSRSRASAARPAAADGSLGAGTARYWLWVHHPNPGLGGRAAALPAVHRPPGTARPHRWLPGGVPARWQCCRGSAGPGTVTAPERRRRRTADRGHRLDHAAAYRPTGANLRLHASSDRRHADRCALRVAQRRRRSVSRSAGSANQTAGGARRTGGCETANIVGAFLWRIAGAACPADPAWGVSALRCGQSFAVVGKRCGARADGRLGGPSGPERDGVDVDAG